MLVRCQFGCQKAVQSMVTDRPSQALPRRVAAVPCLAHCVPWLKGGLGRPPGRLGHGSPLASTASSRKTLPTRRVAILQTIERKPAGRPSGNSQNFASLDDVAQKAEFDNREPAE